MRSPSLSASTAVVGLGEILWDLLPTGKQLGGAPANFAFHAQQLGATGRVVSAVGRDALGQEIEDRLAGANLRRSLATNPTRPTGTVSVDVDAHGVPSYVIHEGVAWDFLPTVAYEAPDADVVCFGTLAQRSPVSRESIRGYLRATRPECLRIFDINLRQHYFSEEVVRESLALAAALKLNDEELPVVAELTRVAGEAAAFASAMFELWPQLRLVALTKGNAGSALFARGGLTSYHDGVKTTVVDTIGAGDAFTATLAMGMLSGHPLDRINDAANRVAAYVCSQPGATPTLPADLLKSLWA